MNWNQIEGNWEQFKGKVQTQWGKLTNDDLDVIKGNRRQLAGRHPGALRQGRGRGREAKSTPGCHATERTVPATKGPASAGSFYTRASASTSRPFGNAPIDRVGYAKCLARRTVAVRQPWRDPECGRRSRRQAASICERMRIVEARIRKPVGSIARTNMPVPGPSEPLREGRRVQRPVGARQSGRQHLHHQRDVGAALAAEGEQHALHRRVRVGRRAGLRCRAPSLPEWVFPRLAALRTLTKAVALDDWSIRSGGPSGLGRREGHRIGAVDRPWCRPIPPPAPVRWWPPATRNRLRASRPVK